MPSVYDIKPRFQSLLRPMVRILAGGGFTANQVTWSALVLSLLVGGCVAWFPEQRWPLILLPATLLLRMALNAVDGMLAREHDMQSRLGAILNELGDVFSDAALYAPLALVPGFDPRLVLLAVILAIISEMAGLVAVQIGASRRYDGPMGKSDRAFTFGVLALLLGCGIPTGSWLDGVMVLVVLLTGFTIWNRARQALREMECAP